jgi:hypothetical protein
VLGIAFKFSSPNYRIVSMKVPVTRCTVPVPVSDVGTPACDWCVKQWVTVIGVGVFAPVSGVRVLPLGRTPRHCVQSDIEKIHTCEWRGPQALFFWNEERRTTAAITVPCALKITSTYVGVFISSSAGWPMNRIDECIRYKLSQYGYVFLGSSL